MDKEKLAQDLERFEKKLEKAAVLPGAAKKHRCKRQPKKSARRDMAKASRSHNQRRSDGKQRKNGRAQRSA